jgi:hypothetical protein
VSRVATKALKDGNTNYGDIATIKEVTAVTRATLFQTAVTYFQIVRQF